MILVIRISGMVEIPQSAQETLDRMRLRQKYAAILLKENEENRKLLDKVRNFVAYGNVDTDTLYALIKTRGERMDRKKVNVDDVIEIVEKEGLEVAGLKPWFRLHPPRGGIDSKRHFGVKKGILGDNKENINKLVRKML